MGIGKHIRFIYNPRSGIIHPEQMIRRIITESFPCNLCDYDFHVTQEKYHAFNLAKEAVDQGYDIVVAIGGDGTVNETACALVNSGVHLGIMPNGSGNGLARGLGIPLSIRRSAKLITTGKVRPIDVGKMENHYFFVTAGFGFDAVIGKRFEDGRMRGPAKYYAIGVREFFRYNVVQYQIKFENHQINTSALVVAVANVREYGNNAIIAPNARPDDGFLDLAIIEQTSLASALYHLPFLFTGRIDRTPFTKIYRATNFEIDREFPAPLTLDGEVHMGGTRFHVTMIPNALNVIVRDINF
ncbi:diacylglycerol kinase family lipid kinase [candidate division KSB1 bacterium]|nr:diacylglycerol kinase family lipid kinase [candidate division KSB1 bacterium]